MARRAERPVQQTLFDLPVVPNKPARRASTARPARGPVTRDPDVALAHEEAYRYAHSVKLGLARIMSSRSEEERAALRALLAKPRVA